jgi:hypothetical protein
MLMKRREFSCVVALLAVTPAISLKANLPEIASMTAIDDFFAKYGEGANNFDPEILSSQYADCFMSADPKGTFCIHNDEKFKEAAAKRERLFRSLGFKFAKIIGKDVSKIDDNYMMAKTHWHMRFDNPLAKKSDFKFFTTYVLVTRGAGLKVVFYISHDDEQKVMKDAGLVPMQPS